MVKTSFEKFIHFFIAVLPKVQMNIAKEIKNALKIGNMEMGKKIRNVCAVKNIK